MSDCMNSPNNGNIKVQHCMKCFLHAFNSNLARQGQLNRQRLQQTDIFPSSVPKWLTVGILRWLQLAGAKLVDPSDTLVMEDEGARMTLKAGPELSQSLDALVTGTIAAVRYGHRCGIHAIH
eukprot:scaffold309142_cov18-Prasinocladus_malaysianus.AAC.1